MKKLAASSFIAAAAALCALASPITAGILTLENGPTFMPPGDFSNNSIVADTIVVGGLIHLTGNVTVTPDASNTAIVEISGAYSAAAGEKFSIAYKFATDLNRETSVTYTLTGSVGETMLEPITGQITPGLNVYEGTAAMPFGFPMPSAGTFSGSMTLDFGADGSQPAAAAPGSLDLSVQQIDFKLDPLPASVIPPAEALNISTRANVGLGDNALIGGFIITGSESKQVVLRAIGPSSGVTGALADPILELHDANGAVIATNDNWMDNSEADQTILTDNMLAPGDDAESALVSDLDPGSYTVIVRGVNDTTGIALVEAYDIENGTTDSILANISTRGFVEAEPNVMIGGFILGGGGGGLSEIIVRGLGPSLTDLGVADALSDPTISLFDADGNVVASNDNWMDDPNEQTIVDHDLAPMNANESAIYEVLPIGAYTVVLSGVAGATGIALVESYDINPPVAGSSR